MYEVYPRSFSDGNADGSGDLAGLRARLDYLVELGVDGMWIAPWYPSPLADGGYDVSDFTDIHPMFGTLAEAEALISEAHEVGLKVIVDLVANHPDHLRAAMRTNSTPLTRQKCDEIVRLITRDHRHHHERRQRRSP